MLCMCGTDCTLAPAEIRENFILSADDIKSLSQLAFETAGINGCQQFQRHLSPYQ
ncbi:MAG: hypothetical protein IJ583_14810 [Firmicutes bacterium]|nr:hypothetical protein [Bacillota bacterium]